MILSRFPKSSLGRLLLFAIGALVSITLGILVAAHVPKWFGFSPSMLMAFASAVIAFFVFWLSAFLLQREGAAVSVLGLPVDGRRIRELAVGFIITSILFYAVACCQSVMVGASWRFQGWSGVSAAGIALGLTACMVLAEELVFRGVGFRYLCAAVGDWPAIVLSALVFGGYHLIGSQNWGMGLAFQFIGPAVGGLLFGWAAVRTGGLALSIGLHWGGNWVQIGIAGFSPLEDLTAPQALWKIPITAADFRLLTAPDLFPRLPYFAAVAGGAVLTWIFLQARTEPHHDVLRKD